MAAQPNYMQLLSVGIQLASTLGAAFESYVEGAEVDIPPVRTYIGTEHVEIDLAIKHLPPP